MRGVLINVTLAIRLLVTAFSSVALLLSNGCTPLQMQESSLVDSVPALCREPQQSCPLTRPSDTAFVPPPPYPLDAGQENFWFGTEQLWTRLPNDGVWSQGLELPKAFWWREGLDWKSGRPPLTVSGRQLDGAGAEFTVDRANSGYTEQLQSFMLTGIRIPNPGCWEITAWYQGDEVTFVVWVSP